MNHSPNRIDAALVKELLSLRPVIVNDGPCEETESVALALGGQAPAEEANEAKAHLDHCEHCRETVHLLEQLTDSGALSPLSDPLTYWQVPPHRNRWWRLFESRGVIAAAALVFLGLVVTLSWSLHEKPRDDGPSTLTVKGGSDEIFVAVKRGSSQFTLDPRGQLSVGDHIGLFYSAQKTGYLAAFGLDSESKVTRLYPLEGDMSSPIAAGEVTSLPGGALVNEGKGCEWIVAVFSDRPMSLDVLNKAVETSKRLRENCGLEIAVEEARTVSVFPYYL